MPAADLVLIDGSSYLYRAFHALPSLSNSTGEPTGALHGVLTMITKLVREQPDSRIAVVFDAPGKTFRDDLYKDYKANRPPMPDDLRAQVDPLLDAVRAMGLPLLRIEGVEADDVIGTLCRQAAEDGQRVLVSTGDKDLAQLVNDSVTLVNTMTDTVIDRDAVKEKFDVYPEQIIDYLALVGDTSDNIPGVPKVGPKTAAKWLNEYDRPTGSSSMPTTSRAKSAKACARTRAAALSASSRRFAWMSTCPSTWPTSSRKPIDAEALSRPLYALRAAHAAAATGRAGRTRPRPRDRRASTRRRLRDRARAGQAFDALARAKSRNANLVAVDTETTSLDYMAAEVVGISLSVKPGEAAYIPVAHDYPGAPDQLSRDEVLDKLKAFLEDDDADKGRPPPEVRRPRACPARHQARAACVTTRCSNPMC